MRGRTSIAVPALAAAVAAIVLASAAPARADARANAEALFQEGKAAMARQDYAVACQKFADSLALEDALGTLLNLALCHEAQGRVGTAWGELREVEQRCLRMTPPQADRARFAHEHAEALAPRLARVRITPAAGVASLKGLEVKVDGIDAPPSLWESGVVVDPGTRTVTAAAKGKKTWSSQVSVAVEGANVVVGVPSLEDAPVEKVDDGGKRRLAGLVIGGVGVALAGAGAAFGVLAIGKGHEAETCSTCKADAYTGAHQAYEDAHTFAIFSDVGIGVGVLAIAAGTWLYLTAPKGVVVKPSVGPGSAGITFAGVLPPWSTP